MSKTHLYVPLYSIWFQGVQRSIHTLCKSCSFLEVINININININIWDRLDKFGLLYNSFLVFSILSFDIQCQQWLRWFVMGEPFDDFRYKPLDCKITNSSVEMHPTPHANFWNNLNYVYTFDVFCAQFLEKLLAFHSLFIGPTTLFSLFSSLS